LRLAARWFGCRFGLREFLVLVASPAVIARFVAGQDGPRKLCLLWLQLFLTQCEGAVRLSEKYFSVT
jgi:hypothetical protein